MNNNDINDYSLFNSEYPLMPIKTYDIPEGFNLGEKDVSNDTELGSGDKNVNNFNKGNMSPNQEKPTFIKAKKVYQSPEYLKKRKREKKKIKQSSKKNRRRSYLIRTTESDKSKNNPNSDNYIIKKIKKQILKDLEDKSNQSKINKTKNRFELTKGAIKHGRKNKNSSEKGKHSRFVADNINDNNWIVFFDLIRNSLNDLIKQYNSNGKNYDFLKNTNYKKQYYPDNKKDLNFMNKKLYDYLIYDPPADPKYKGHRNFGSFNKDIINQIENVGKDQLFIALIKEDIRTIYNIFIGDEKNKNKSEKYNLSNFKILKDYSNELRKLLENEKFNEEVIKEIILYFNNKFNDLH